MIFTLYCAQRAVGVGGGDGRAHGIERHTVGGQPHRVQLHTHSGQGTAVDRGLPHAIHLRQLLRQHRAGRVIHLATGQRFRRQRQNHDGRVCRVDLAVGRVAWHAGGQQGPRRVDGGLDIMGRAINRARQVKLQRNARAAHAGAGRHLVDARNRAQRPLQRGGHGGGHGVRGGTRQTGGDRDRRIVHLRQRGHGQQKVGHATHQRHAYGQQDGGDGAEDERRGNAHGFVPPCSPMTSASECGRCLTADRPRLVRQFSAQRSKVR